jgi:hypothetical protein
MPYSYLFATISGANASNNYEKREITGDIVTLRTFTVFLWVGLIATASIAGEEHQSYARISVGGDDRIIDFEHVLDDTQDHEIHEDCIIR